MPTFSSLRPRLAASCLCLLSLLLGAAGAQAAGPSPFVARSGTQLVLGGSPYRFTGLNIYNANSTGNCWYDMVSGSTLGDSLDAIGSGKEAFRAWFFQSFATLNGRRDWTAFDHTLAVARSHGVKVIVTLGNQWGDCETGGYRNDRWYVSGYLTQRDPGSTLPYAAWVAQVVARYRNDPTILAWQLINEAEVKPSAASSDCSVNAARILRTFAGAMSILVKLIDRNHLISLGTMGGGQCGAQGDEYQSLHSLPTLDLCEYHDYQPGAAMPGDQFNGLQRRLDQCGALHKPLFVGEVGIRPSDVGDGSLGARADMFAAKFAAQFAAGVAGELAWAWNKDFSTPADYDIGPGDPSLGVLAAY
jgi:mannan endo-1,4-beta-mannosidase